MVFANPPVYLVTLIDKFVLFKHGLFTPQSRLDSFPKICQRSGTLTASCYACRLRVSTNLRSRKK